MALQTLQKLTEGLRNGIWDETLSRIYGDGASRSAGRLLELAGGFCDFYGADGDTPVAFFSCPGRTELGGNHTDHQRGRSLAASVDLDTIACVRRNDSGVIRVKSQYHRMAEIDLSRLSPQAEETGTSPSLVRGIAARISALGYPVGGFDAYTTTQVLRGRGLSSSAAFEVLVGTIINHLFYNQQCTPIQIAQIGQYAENVYFGKPSGLLDQMASSVGNMVTVDFADNANPIVERVDFDFAHSGHALCIVDSGADHADLTDEYAAVTRELGEVCAHFGKTVLREVPEADFYGELPTLRRKAGDRAVLRAIHIYEDNRRVEQQVKALRAGDFDAFLKLVTASGLSSWRLLQNVVPAGYTHHQEVAVALTVCEKLLGGRGACRVHGGGFAGTIQAFVPLDILDRFRGEMERILGDGSCHVLSIRPVGGVRLV